MEYFDFLNQLVKRAMSLYASLLSKGEGFPKDINYPEIMEEIEQTLVEAYGTTPLHKAFPSTSSVITDNSAALFNNGLTQAQHAEQRDMCGNKQQTNSSRPLFSCFYDVSEEEPEVESRVEIHHQMPRDVCSVPYLDDGLDDSMEDSLADLTL